MRNQNNFLVYKLDVFRQAQQATLNIKPKITNDADDLILVAKLKINTKATRDPNNEARIINQGELRYTSNPKIENKKITVPTPKLAIEVTPKTDGSANGFLNNSCIKKPATGRAIPTKIAAIAFGIRKFKIKLVDISSEFPLKTAKISLIGIATLPTLKLMINKNKMNIRIPINAIFSFIETKIKTLI